jgi:hypothetical protein
MPSPKGRIESLDSVFRSLTREIRWRQVSDRLRQKSPQDGDAFLVRLGEVVASVTEFELRMLQDGRPRNTPLPNVRETLRDVLSMRSTEVRLLLATKTVAELETKGHDLGRTVAADLRSRLSGIQIWPNWIPTAIEGAQFVSSCQHALDSPLPALLETIHAAPDVSRQVLAEGLASVFQRLRKWEIAVAIQGVIPVEQIKGSEVVLTVEELQARWSPKTFAGRPGELYLLAKDISATDHYDAAARGLLVVDIALATAWNDWRGRHPLDFGSMLFARLDTLPETLAATRPTVWMMELRHATLGQLSDSLRSALSGLAGKHRSLWQRLGAALLQMREAGTTKAPHRRFAALWFALEALLDNLDIDSEASSGSIGTRVSARVAALQPPDEWMSEMTFAQVREFYADLAFALYKLRNVTVHEAELAPPVDDILAEQLEQMATIAVRNVLAAARSGTCDRIEQVVAYCLSLNEPSTPALDGKR